MEPTETEKEISAHDQLALSMTKVAHDLADQLVSLPHDGDPVTVKTILYRFAGSEKQYSINARTEAPGVYLAMLLARTAKQLITFRLISVHAADSFKEPETHEVLRLESAPTASEEAIEV